MAKDLIPKEPLVNKLSESIRMLLKRRQELICYQQRLYDKLKDTRLPHEDYIKAERAYEQNVAQIDNIEAEIAGWEQAREIVMDWGVNNFG